MVTIKPCVSQEAMAVVVLPVGGGGKSRLSMPLRTPE